MNLDFSIEKVIQARSSIRAYSDRLLEETTLKKLHAYMETLSNPFSGKVRFRLLESNVIESEKLGTYGMIKGAKCFIGVAVENGDMALEALGYELEQLVLYATSLELGTCWLGGTFNRGRFAKAMEVEENEIFPIVTPIGYASDKKRIVPSLIRKLAKFDQRKPWDSLFFDNNFSTPLSQEDAKEYASVLDQVRLGPSASNFQPWRIVRQGDSYHFYEAKTKGYAERASYDIQKVDMGIAACHFHLSAAEKGISGEFQKLVGIDTAAPENTDYLFTWTAKASNEKEV